MYLNYREALAECEKRQKPTDGLFGFGHPVKEDVCHDRFDKSLSEVIGQFVEAKPDPATAARMIRQIFTERDRYPYPRSAEWMLYASERHILSLVPLLESADAAGLCAEYSKRYKPWNRLPAQKDVYRALKAKSARKTKD